MKIRFSGGKKKQGDVLRIDPKRVKERIRASKRIPQARSKGRK